jgi:hypothetical protein
MDVMSKAETGKIRTVVHGVSILVILNKFGKVSNESGESYAEKTVYDRIALP